MATSRAIANGNWSATSTWNGGVLPSNGDTVYANGFTVTIDQNVTIGGANNPSVNAGSFVSGQWYQITFVGTTSFTGIGASANTVGTIFLATGAGTGTGTATALATITTATNTAAGATAGGGSFAMSTLYTFNCDIRAGTSSCFNLSTTTGTLSLSNLTIIAGSANPSYAITVGSSALISILNCSIFGGSGTGFLHGIINNNTSGTITISSSTINCGTGGGAYGVANNSSGTINITGSTINGLNVSSAYGVANLSASGSIVLSNCNINGGSVSSSYALYNQSTGSLNISSSNITAGGVSALVNASTGSVIATGCTFTASSGANAVTSSNTAADVQLSGTFIDAANGYTAIYCPKWRLGTQPINARHQMAWNGINTFVNFYTADNNLGQAVPSDVRNGVSYASGSLTGTLTVPSEGTVANGVTVGPLMPFTATRSSTTATVTLAYSYPYVSGDTIVVTGASNTEWNGTYTIASVISGTSITFTVPVTYSSTAGTGAKLQTVGTAMLTAASIFNTLTSTMTTPGSIGERLANVSTVAVTGQQITSALG